jgi:hypothetical protein
VAPGPPNVIGTIDRRLINASNLSLEAEMNFTAACNRSIASDQRLLIVRAMAKSIEVFLKR